MTEPPSFGLLVLSDAAVKNLGGNGEEEPDASTALQRSLVEKHPNGLDGSSVALYTGQTMILLVEDDGPSSRATTLALKTAGHEVINAGDGTEALELLAKHHFELVITDLVLPKLNGLNLINTIRLKWPDMPLILTSGYLAKDGGKAIIDGKAVFLQKPFTPTALIMAVERVLSKPK